MKNIKKIILGVTAIILLFTFTFQNKIIASEFIPPNNNDFIVKHRKTELAPGIIENEIIYNNNTGTNPVSGYLVDINPETTNVGVMAATTNYNETGTQTVLEMAKAAELKTNRRIIAGINADLNWDGTGLSNGPMIVDGKIIHDEPSPFVGIKKNGQAIIGTEEDYLNIKNDLQHAVTARMGWLVRDGEVVNGNPTLHPRTAVGIKADGSLFFYVVEGRAEPRSRGIGLYDLAVTMKNYGAVHAINLDGGGSTTYISRRPGNNHMEVTSFLSDGRERPSISSLLIYTEEGDGIFRKANISTEGNAFTPNTEVQFTAKGVDNVGGAAELPKNLTWELEDSFYGEIDNNGLFLSSGEEGTVVVNLKDSDDVIVGSGSIEILIPDEIEFRSSDFSLGFEESTDFSLRLLNNKQELIYKDGDVIWESFYLDENDTYQIDSSNLLGTIENNVFTSNLDNSIEGKIIATVKGNESVSKELTIIVGQLPRVIFDFEDEDTNHLWGNSQVNGATSNVSIVDRDSGEPVRFGSKSLKLDFDYRGMYTKPGGAYVTLDPSIEDYGYELELPGVPSSLGMWIYGTEESQGLWPRVGIGINGSTSWKAHDLTLESSGIDWLGWKFVEIDLSNQAPKFTIISGQFIRLMLTVNSFGGEDVKPYGSLYIDNITALYGYNPEDTNAPVVDEINLLDRGNTVNLDKDKEINFNEFTIESSFHDFENNFTSGINYDDVNLYIDGINYSDSPNFEISPTDSSLRLTNVALDDGVHEIRVEVYDNSGNQGTMTRFITVKTGKSPELYLDYSEHVVLGKPYELTLRAKNIDLVEEIDISIKISEELNDLDIEFLNGFTGTIDYISSIKQLNIEGVKTGPSTGDEIFVLTSNISKNLVKGTNVRFSIQSATYKYSEAKDTFNSFSIKPSVIAVEAPLVIDSELITINEDGIFYVYDNLGNPLSDVELILINGSVYESLGFTDENGMLVTDRFTNGVEAFTIIARLYDDQSFEFKGQSFDSQGDIAGDAFGIIHNGVVDPHESKSFTWLSNSFANNQNSVVRFGIKGQFDPSNVNSYEEVFGTNQTFSFFGSPDIFENYVININNVTIGGLEQGTYYEFQVGNGDVWSETREFRTLHKFGDVDFFILGDIQSSMYDNIFNNLNAIGDNIYDYDFGMQVGDFIDNGNRFDHWGGVLNSLSNSSVSHLDIIKTLGNHEFYGDEDGDKAKAIFNTPNNRDYYSLEYGSVYVAVVSYDFNRESLTQKLEWVLADANNSNAKWKILITHQPPYYTNAQGGNGLVNELVPKYAEMANLDFVVSGHDHTYARTKPLVNGVEDVNGVRYIIAGSFGEKGYPYSGSLFNFEVVEAEIKHIYLSAEVRENRMTIKVFSAVTNELIDDFTVRKDDFEHEHIYILEGDRLVCYECNYSRPLEGYAGFLRDADGNIMHYMNGEYQKGLLILGNSKYFFDEEGFAYTGEQEIWGLRSVFDENGLLIEGGTGFVEENGKTRYYEEFEMYRYGWSTIGDDLYYFSSYDGTMRSGKTPITDERGITVIYNFADDGRLLNGTWRDTPNGMTYYYGGISTGWMEIDGYLYYFSGSNGVIRTGDAYIWIGDTRYTMKFNEFGQLIEGAFAEYEDGIKYHFGGIDSFYTGFKTINGKIYYFDELGYLQTGTFSVDGKEINTDEKGVIID